MVIEEIINERLVRHYSDQGKTILQEETGIEYSEAVDVIPCRYTYEETENDIEPEADPDAATEADYLDALREMGVAV